ncbi:uncharacterized protein HD556DRAFT_1204342, partial [Suillus plorans]
DTTTIFTLTAREGQPELVNEVWIGLNHVWRIAFRSDDYLVVGGVEGGGVKLFERIDDGKRLEEIAKLGAVIVGCPTGFLW